MTVQDEDGQLDGVFHYIPLLSTIEGLLKQDHFRKQVDEWGNRIRSDGVLEDYCDGSVYKNRALFSMETKSIQIIAYFDELEICNPLGTHVKKHKLGIIFYTIGNIDPKYRSSYKAVNLTICARSVLIEKHGINVILKPNIDDLNTLYTSGINLVW
jgi:hypothetical protein